MTRPRNEDAIPGIESALDIGALLTIDVAAEVRKLGQAELGGSWQVPGELAARAVRAAARSVSVSFDRKGFTLRDDARPISRATLASLSSILDPRAAPDDRHRALLALEQAGELALVALVAAGAESLAISSGATLRWTRTSGVSIHEDAARATSIEVVLPGLDRAEARRWLGSAFRFLASARVEVDGAAVSTAFTGALASDAVRGLSGTVAIPREGETARVWLLLDGIVATHLGIPSAPCFEAAVEMRGLAKTPAEARDAIVPHLAELEAQASALAARVARKMSGLIEPDRTRVRSMILVAAKRGSREAADAPVFESIAAGAVERWLSLRELQALSSGGRPIAAIYPHLDPGAFVLPAASALAVLLDAADRARLAPLLGVAFVAPPARPPSRSRLSHLVEAALTALSSLRGVLSRPLPDAALTASERHLLEALRARLPLDIAFCAGRAAPRASARGRLLLARENRVVRAAVAAVARDPRLAPVAAIALAPHAAA